MLGVWILGKDLLLLTGDCNILKATFRSVHYFARGGNGQMHCKEYTLRLKQGSKCCPIYFLIQLTPKQKKSLNTANTVYRSCPTHKTYKLCCLQIILFCSLSLLGLQNQWNILKSAAYRLRFQDDTNGTKVEIFNLGGLLVGQQKGYLEYKNIEIVGNNNYCSDVLSAKFV